MFYKVKSCIFRSNKSIIKDIFLTLNHCFRLKVESSIDNTVKNCLLWSGEKYAYADQALFTSKNTQLFTSEDIMYWISCDVFISCLDSHSDGTHSLQRIHWWASDVMLHFSKSFLIKKQTHLHLDGLSAFLRNLNLGWTIEALDDGTVEWTFVSKGKNVSTSIYYFLTRHSLFWPLLAFFS